MLDTEWITDLDADAACASVVECHEARVRAEFELFALAAHWADLHSGAALTEQRRRSGVRVRPGMERAKQIGADGTPTVAEFAAAEFGALQGMGHIAAEHQVRDALNVRHRHPRLWAGLRAGVGRVWQARKVAQLCASAGLSLEQADWVDEQTSEYLGALPWGRFESLVTRKIAEVDPAAAEERRQAAAMRRFVATGQSSEYGLKTLVARASAGDVIFFVAMVDRIAQVLADRGDTDPVDVRRSKAIGILATPARALLLLESAASPGQAESGTGPDDGRDEGDPAEAEDPDVVSESDVHPSQNDADDPAPEPRPCPSCCGTGQVTGDPRPFTRPDQIDPRKLLPTATLYLHASEEMLKRDGEGVAIFEGVGAVTRSQLVEILGHTNVRVVRVIDIDRQEPVDAYQVPDRMTEALYLRNPACVFPWAAHTSRRKDKDHVVPYVPRARGGPPRQTSMENLALLSRFPHRLKTHGRWRLRKTRPGAYEWRSPHGFRFLVDDAGAHPLGRLPEHGDADSQP